MRIISYYTIDDLLKEAKEVYGITDAVDDTIYDGGITRKIQRITEKYFKDLPKSGNSKLYTRQQVEFILFDEAAEYLKERASDAINKDADRKLKTDREYNYLIETKQEELEEQYNKEKEYDEMLMDKLDLETHYYYLLKYDKGFNHDFLKIDELIILNRKGLVLYDSLDDFERSRIEFNNADNETNQNIEINNKLEAEKKKQRFEDKKLAIMINALFSEKFELNSSLLYTDLSFKDIFEQKGFIETTPEILRAVDRLKDDRNYYSLKEIEDDEDF